MSQKSNLKSKSKSNPLDTRRQFIKRKLIGGLFGIVGLPFLSFGRDVYSSQDENATPSKELSDIDNWDEIRNQFSLHKTTIHLNTSSQGPSPDVVVNKIIEKLQKEESTASYKHSIVTKTRLKISSFLNADPDQIAITRNATEGMNIVGRSLNLKRGDEVVMSKDEHIGGAAIWIALEKQIGIKVVLIDLDYSGKNNLKIIKKSLTEKTKVVMVSHITCTTGMILPVKKIADLCREKGIISVIDGAQALGAIPIDLTEINPDFYISSGHKWLFGPKGTGIIFMNKQFLESNPPHYAGAYSDSKFNLASKTLEFLNVASREEYGTRNYPIIAGLGSAVDFINQIGAQRIHERGKELSQIFIDRVFSNQNIEILSPSEESCKSSIVTFRVKHKDNIEISKSIRRKKQIRIRGVYENNLNSLRASFAIFNSEEEVNLLADTILELASN